MCHFWALADVAAANPPSVMPPVTSVLAAGRYVAPAPGGFVGPRAGRLIAATQVKNILQRPLGDVRSCVTVCFWGDGSSSMHSEAGFPGA
jgi:hypothetical protein